MKCFRIIVAFCLAMSAVAMQSPEASAATRRTPVKNVAQNVRAKGGLFHRFAGKTCDPKTGVCK
jgi:hypothetical protein